MGEKGFFTWRKQEQRLQSWGERRLQSHRFQAEAPLGRRIHLKPGSAHCAVMFQSTNHQSQGAAQAPCEGSASAAPQMHHSRATECWQPMSPLSMSPPASAAQGSAHWARSDTALCSCLRPPCPTEEGSAEPQPSYRDKHAAGSGICPFWGASS